MIKSEMQTTFVRVDRFDIAWRDCFLSYSFSVCVVTCRRPLPSRFDCFELSFLLFLGFIHTGKSISEYKYYQIRSPWIRKIRIEKIIKMILSNYKNNEKQPIHIQLGYDVHYLLRYTIYFKGQTTNNTVHD